MKIDREIFRLAIPNIISNFSVPLLSSVDTILMGHLSVRHLAAVGIGGMIFNFLFWILGFLRMGTTGFTAQAYGRRDRAGQVNHLWRGLILAVGIAVLIILLAYPIYAILGEILHLDDINDALVYDYFSIRLWAAPATLSLYVIMGWFFGMQNPYYPLILTVFINICNIVVSFWLVRQWGWEIHGVAYGTLLAQWLGVTAALFILASKHSFLFLKIRWREIFNTQALVSNLRINGNIFIRTLSLTLVFMLFYRQSVSLGVTILAANVILLQLLNWMSYAIDGFAYAAESLTGKYYGGSNEKRFHLSVKRSMWWGFVMSLAIGAVYYYASGPIGHLYTNEGEVLNYYSRFVLWMAIVPVIGFACYIWDGVFVGMTAGKAMRNSMMAAFAGYLLLYYFLLPDWGNTSIWIALTAFLALRGIIQTWLFSRHKLALK